MPGPVIEVRTVEEMGGRRRSPSRFHNLDGGDMLEPDMNFLRDMADVYGQLFRMALSNDEVIGAGSKEDQAADIAEEARRWSMGMIRDNHGVGGGTGGEAGRGEDD